MSFTCKHLQIDLAQKRLVDISFSFERSFALIGESGSGKSLSLKALMGMLPKEFRSTLELGDNGFALKRGESVAIVPQNPFTALSPLTKIKDQFFVPRKIAAEHLEMVGLAESLLDRFPSELSGGQLQRIVLAIILHIKPQLLLLDEPTTALDVQSKKDVLELIKSLHVALEFKLIFVTHDIESVVNLCEEIAILQNGKIVETARMDTLLESPQTQYAKQLINAGFAKRGFRR